jgi:hypothetical protein
MWEIVKNRLERNWGYEPAIGELIVADPDADPYGTYCGACGRVTDHFAEHDDLVDLGQVNYSTNGDVITRQYFTTRFAKQEREVLADMTDLMIDQSIAGKVTLIKPVGAALTYRWIRYRNIAHGTSYPSPGAFTWPDRFDWFIARPRGVTAHGPQARKEA